MHFAGPYLQLYLYYALELNGDTPVADNGSITYSEQKYHVDYTHPTYNDEGAVQSGELKTTITNTPSTSLSGTKTWKDNSNAYGTRPDEETFKANLKLSWSTDSELFEEVDLAAEGIVLTITFDQENTNKWTYTFDNLPMYDKDGKPYTYKVTEDVPGGYKETNGGEGTTENNQTNFTNTLTGTVTITGTKTWEGGSGSTTPTLTLQQSTNGTDWETATDNQPNWTGTGSTQTYTYTGLPKYNENGMLYQYRVTETVPGGYDVYYVDGIATDVGDNQSEKQPDTPVKNLDIRNVKRGSLTVSKQVTGNRGDRDQQFDFS